MICLYATGLQGSIMGYHLRKGKFKGNKKDKALAAKLIKTIMRMICLAVPSVSYLVIFERIITKLIDADLSGGSMLEKTKMKGGEIDMEYQEFKEKLDEKLGALKEKLEWLRENIRSIKDIKNHLSELLPILSALLVVIRSVPELFDNLDSNVRRDYSCQYLDGWVVLKNPILELIDYYIFYILWIAAEYYVDKHFTSDDAEMTVDEAVTSILTEKRPAKIMRFKAAA